MASYRRCVFSALLFDLLKGAHAVEIVGQLDEIFAIRPGRTFEGIVGLQLLPSDLAQATQQRGRFLCCTGTIVECEFEIEALCDTLPIAQSF